MMPSALGVSFRNQGNNKKFKLTHRELINIGILPNSQALYIVNPTNNALFPWLSSIAYSFEKYELINM